MLILDLWVISCHGVVLFGLGKNLLFKSVVLGHCVLFLCNCVFTRYLWFLELLTTNFYKKGSSTYLMKAYELNWKIGLQKWFQLTVMYLQFIIPRDILSVLCLHCQPIRVTYFSIEVFTSKFRISRHLSRFFSPSGTLYIGK